MADDSFAFDAYDRLVNRTSMASSPISVIVRGADPAKLDEVISRCQSMLTGRRHSDEIMLGFRGEPAFRPSSTFGRLSVRTVVHPRIVERQGMAWLLANARWPVAVFAGADAELPIPAFRNMIESLEHADVVVGNRRFAKGLRRPTAWLARRLFGVPVADPLSPFLALRREAIAGVPLTFDEPLTSFELLAKLTFALAMYHEVEIDLPANDEEPLHQTLRTRWRDLARLFRRPTFWNYSKGSAEFRLAPQETKPPQHGDSGFGAAVKSVDPHPLRRRPEFARQLQGRMLAR